MLGAGKQLPKNEGSFVKFVCTSMITCGCMSTYPAVDVLPCACTMFPECAGLTQIVLTHRHQHKKPYLPQIYNTIAIYCLVLIGETPCG